MGTGRWRSDSVAPGFHVVTATLRSAGRCPSAVQRDTLTLVAGTVLQRELDPVPCGELEIDVRPQPARFRITRTDGGPTLEGTLPLDRALVLPVGIYRLDVNAGLCTPFADTVTVNASRRRLPLRLICG